MVFTLRVRLRQFEIAPSDFVEPLDFMARLGALVPRPRTHLIRFHGPFAPNARHRRLVVPSPVSDGAEPEPRVVAAILAHLETRAARAPPPARH